MIPSDLRYTKEHEWVRVAGDEATVGITDYAAAQLGDIVFVELPDPGGEPSSSRPRRGRVRQGRQRPVRAVAGAIIARNEDLADRPELVNGDPYGDGWMVRIRLTDPDQLVELLDAEAETELTAED
jgi:glycine cleavage system H protein